MALLELLSANIREPVTWVALLLGVLTAYVLLFISRVKHLPPGPPPIPLLGNLLQLRTPRPLYEKAVDWSREYGDPFTLWIGSRPFVIASTKDSFADISGPLRNLVADRPTAKFNDLQKRGHDDVIFSDFTPAWDVLRRLTHVAIRKYAQTNKLAELVAEIVDREVRDLLNGGKEARCGIVEYVESILCSVLAISTAGENFGKDQEDFKTFRRATITFENEAANGLPSDILPILGWIYLKRERSVTRALEDFFGVTDRMFEQAKASWIKGHNRHFTDFLLNAREEFIAEDRGSAKYLHDENLKNVVFDIFGAGTGTSKTLLSFSFLHLANDPELQEELREEIMSELGPRICEVDDRRRMPKMDAFLQEVIRYHAPAPLGVGRRTQANVSLNGRFVPKHTDMFTNVYAVNRDKSIWGPDAEEFNPSRFLTASKEQINRGAVSFGVGARSCPGEKMAQADMFYVLVRTLQSLKLSCVNGPGTADLLSIDSDLLHDARRQDLIFTECGSNAVDTH